MERRALTKQVQGLRRESARQQKANADLRLNVKQLSQERQALKKVCKGGGGDRRKLMIIMKKGERKGGEREI